MIRAKDVKSKTLTGTDAATLDAAVLAFLSGLGEDAMYLGSVESANAWTLTIFYAE